MQSEDPTSPLAQVTAIGIKTWNSADATLARLIFEMMETSEQASSTAKWRRMARLGREALMELPRLRRASSTANAPWLRLLEGLHEDFGELGDMMDEAGWPRVTLGLVS